MFIKMWQKVVLSKDIMLHLNQTLKLEELIYGKEIEPSLEKLRQSCWTVSLIYGMQQMIYNNFWVEEIVWNSKKSVIHSKEKVLRKVCMHKQSSTS